MSKLFLTYGPVDLKNESAVATGFLWGEGHLYEYTSTATVIEGLSWSLQNRENYLVEGKVVFTGSRKDAADYILNHGGLGKAVNGAELTVGNHQTVITGHLGKSIAGDYGIAISKNHGFSKVKDYGTAIAGNFGKAIAGIGSRAITGAAGESRSEDYSTSITGHKGKAMAGAKGNIVFEAEVGFPTIIVSAHIDSINYFSYALYQLNKNNEIIPAIEALKTFSLPRFFSLKFLKQIQTEPEHIQYIQENLDQLDPDSQTLFLNYVAAGKICY